MRIPRQAASVCSLPLCGAVNVPAPDSARPTDGRSGLLRLDDPHDAFAARLALVENARTSIDIQCYIWSPDLTGLMMLDALADAAGRGVRVRLLLDDVGSFDLGDRPFELAGVDGLQIRLFNPLAWRRHLWLGYLVNFRRANRRMHNKLFIVDGRHAIVGGRNMADEYFAADSGRLFTDLDALVTGTAVSAMSADFERYWTSRPAMPVRPRGRAADAGAVVSALKRQTKRLLEKQRGQTFMQHVRASVLSHPPDSWNLSLVWARARLISDSPGKVKGRAGPKPLIAEQLQTAVGLPQRSIHIVSPYFVPTRSGARLFARLARSGVKVIVLTNSLAATDVAAVHSGYSRYRKYLLKSGVKLYEMRRLDGALRPHSGAPLSAGSSLHAKTFAVDGRRLFIGSFNFDPRSARLNTEVGLLIASKTLARQLENLFSGQVPAQAYKVQLGPRKRLQWLEHNANGLTCHRREPDVSLWRRLCVAILARLPIEGLL